jgi:transposase
LTTKVHALVDALGNPCNLMLTPGQSHDLTCVQPLLENADPGALIGDKAYDADSLIDTLTQRAITPVIPPKANRKVKRDCDFALYRERNLVVSVRPITPPIASSCVRSLLIDWQIEERTWTWQRRLPARSSGGLRAQRVAPPPQIFRRVRRSARPVGDGQPLGFQFQGKSSPMRLIG